MWCLKGASVWADSQAVFGAWRSCCCIEAGYTQCKARDLRSPCLRPGAGYMLTINRPHLACCLIASSAQQQMWQAAGIAAPAHFKGLQASCVC